MSRLLKSVGGFGIFGLLLLLASGAAHAGTITFNFDNCGGGGTGSCGATSTYTVGGFTIIAKAELAGSNNLLWAKMDGGLENGLGLSSDTTQHEITFGHFIQLDISSIPVSDDPLTITMGSTTGTEAWRVVETDMPDSMSGATFDAAGNFDTSFMISPTHRYLDFTETTEGGNVLLSSLSFNTPAVPEPSSLVLLGSGILGLAGAVRRKLKA